MGSVAVEDGRRPAVLPVVGPLGLLVDGLVHVRLGVVAGLARLGVHVGAAHPTSVSNWPARVVASGAGIRHERPWHT